MTQKHYSEKKKKEDDDSFDLNSWYIPEKKEEKKEKKEKKNKNKKKLSTTKRKHSDTDDEEEEDNHEEEEQENIENDNHDTKHKTKKEKKEKKESKKLKGSDASAKKSRKLKEAKQPKLDNDDDDMSDLLELDTEKKPKTKSKDKKKKKSKTEIDDDNDDITPPSNPERPTPKKSKTDDDESKDEEEATSKRKTRRELKEEQRVAELEGNEGDKKSNGMKQPKRTAFGVWVGNLAFTTTESSLRTLFEPCGVVARVNMPVSDRRATTNKGFAYVDFETEEAVEAAVKLSESTLEGRTLLIKNSKNYEKTGRPSYAPAKPEDSGADPASSSSSSAAGAPRRLKEPSSTIFVGNLSFGTTEESLQKLFADRDGLRKVRMPTFEDSGNCKGFAYLDFSDADKAAAAIAVGTKKPYLNGRVLRLEFAGADAARRATPLKLRQKIAAKEAAEKEKLANQGADAGDAKDSRRRMGGGGGRDRERGGSQRGEGGGERDDGGRRSKGRFDSFEVRPLGVPNPKAKHSVQEVAQKPPSAAVVPFGGKKTVFADDD